MIPTITIRVFLFDAAYIPPGPPVTYTFARATDVGDDSQRDDGVLPVEYWPDDGMMMGNLMMERSGFTVVATSCIHSRRHAGYMAAAQGVQSRCVR